MVYFEHELSSRRTKRSLDTENTISQEEYFRLVEKYDGAMAGGPAGAIVGAIGANVLAGYFKFANNDMKRWLDVDSSKGGCRITLTEEFPISSLGSTTQSAIKKL